MPDNTGPEENDVESTAEHAPVIWPEPSRLDSWWRDIMTDPSAAVPVAEPESVPPSLTRNG
ncbi:hypothetical protein [Nocardia grenadensis]|uniref:hypothetical protein n=1 Tax=Nocardia grenadensis TaxID=931537 RepID=UPI0007A49EA2|nr:hypothetical protein [Nocardia grenadensis]